MRNLREDPAHPGERRHGGDEVLALLGSYRSVLAWVNGHSHKNKITPHSAPDGRSFWEVSTASHIDFPQLARVIEIVDNHDGTVSLFTTLIESGAPHAHGLRRPHPDGPGRPLPGTLLQRPGRPHGLDRRGRETATRSWC